RELRPVQVDFFLAVATDHEGYGLGELEHRPAVDGGVALPLESESHAHDLAGRAAGDVAAGLALARDPVHSPFLEKRDIEWSGLLGLVVEPQARRDLLTGDDVWHGSPLLL